MIEPRNTAYLNTTKELPENQINTPKLSMISVAYIPPITCLLKVSELSTSFKALDRQMIIPQFSEATKRLEKAASIVNC